MEQSNKQQPLSHDDLLTIHGFEFLGFESSADKVETIYNRFSLVLGWDRQVVKMVAFLDAGDTPVKDVNNCSLAMGLSFEETAKILDRLERDDIIVTCYSSYVDEENFITEYRLTERAHREIRKLEMMQNITEEQFHLSVVNLSKDIERDESTGAEKCKMLEQIMAVNPDFQFSKGYDAIKANDLPLPEKCALFFMAAKFIEHGTTPFEVNELTNKIDAARERQQKLNEYIGRIQGEKQNTSKSEPEVLKGYPSQGILFSGLKGLINNGMVSAVPDEGFKGDRGSNKKRYILSSGVCAELFRGMTWLIDYENISHQADLVKSGSIVEKELFFDESVTSELQMLKDLVNPVRFDQLAENLKKHGMTGSVSVLLHGAPGTGKTELVRQLARQSGRDILNVDVAKLSGAYVGESEKNMRELFRNFRYLNALSERAPILLFNEADGIIGKRLQLRHSLDKSENAVMTIILQELETVEGIFIATTNLVDNIDSAMDRRFLFKIEFNKPSLATATRIWRSKIPELSEDEALALAGEFDFSGGQIDNIVKRRLLSEVLNMRTPSAEEMREYCLHEQLRSKETAGNSIPIRGFVQFVNS